MAGDTPRVSVLLPVYQGEKYLREAMDSILSQTFTDFEFIIVDDASTDRSAEIIKSYRDPRIRFIQNESNIGLIGTLNRGLDAAKGEYIARMDQDDVSLPQRLERQVAFMDANPDVGACSTWALDIDPQGKIIGKRETLTGEQLDNLYWRTSLIHPAAMFRFRGFSDLRYDPRAHNTEDYDLWFRIRTTQRLSNLPEYLLHYRVHDESISATRFALQIQTAYTVFCRHLNTQRISYEAFLAMMCRSYDYNPIKRAIAMSYLARLIHKNPRVFLQDNLDYLRGWSSHRPHHEQASKGLAGRAIRFVVRCISYA